MELTTQLASQSFPTLLGDDFAAEQAHAGAEQAIRQTVGNPFSANPRMTCRNVAVFYGSKCAIRSISIDVGCNEVLAMIGPSGCGK